jgi:hypothetical protein
VVYLNHKRDKGDKKMKNIFKNLFKKETTRVYDLYTQKTENSPVEVEMVDEYYLDWWVVSGKDLDYFKVWVEERA